MQLHLEIHGRVQGVFFRQSAKSEAIALGLAGWIRNNKDGTVEAIVQGSKESIDKFLLWCKSGPPMAKVENVEVEWLKQGQELVSFEII